MEYERGAWINYPFFLDPDSVLKKHSFVDLCNCIPKEQRVLRTTS